MIIHNFVNATLNPRSGRGDGQGGVTIKLVINGEEGVKGLAGVTRRMIGLGVGVEFYGNNLTGIIFNGNIQKNFTRIICTRIFMVELDGFLKFIPRVQISRGNLVEEI
jgi:hypothetical protein